MVEKLEQYPQMRFIYAEMSFFALWWSQIDPAMRQRVKKSVAFSFFDVLFMLDVGAFILGVDFEAFYMWLNK